MAASDRADERSQESLGLRLLMGMNVCFSRIYHNVELLTPCTLPHSGPAILVCNHISGLDPLLIQSCSRRLIVWMMAKEFYDITVLNWVFRTAQSIPVTRSGRDLAATRAAMRALERGRVLGVFPEGKIEATRELLPFQTGVALMAIKTGVPVYPAYMEGTQRGREMVPALVRRSRAKLAFGPAVEFERSGADREALARATAAIEGAVARQRQTAWAACGKSFAHKD